MNEVTGAYAFAIGRAAKEAAEKPTFDLATMSEGDRREMWPDLAHFCHSPADACLVYALQASIYDDDARKDRHKRKLEKRAIAREAKMERFL